MEGLPEGNWGELHGAKCGRNELDQRKIVIRWDEVVIVYVKTRIGYWDVTAYKARENEIELHSDMLATAALPDDRMPKHYEAIAKDLKVTPEFREWIASANLDMEAKGN